MEDHRYSQAQYWRFHGGAWSYGAALRRSCASAIPTSRLTRMTWPQGVRSTIAPFTVSDCKADLRAGSLDNVPALRAPRSGKRPAGIDDPCRRSGIPGVYSVAAPGEFSGDCARMELTVLHRVLFGQLAAHGEVGEDFEHPAVFRQCRLFLL